MSDEGIARTFEALRRAAEEGFAATRDGRTRVTVQVGHCSRSVGADRVLAALKASLPENAYLVVAGCDGACFQAPQVVIIDPSGGKRKLGRVTPEQALRLLRSDDKTSDDAGEMFFQKQRRIALADCGELDCTDIDDYVSRGGYAGLSRALQMTPEEVIEQAKSSGLRGRGGAYFPAGVKWEGARNARGAPTYLIVNSEEGEPGIFKDRHLMEGVPHRIVEGAIIAAYASGAGHAYVYINAEADLSAQRMEESIRQAYHRGLLGTDVLGSGFGLEVEVRRGAGGYVCGEETTLLNTMEGYRREPRLRPPFPTESGLWSKPTVINNAETLASVPFIMANGHEAFRGQGGETDVGTKIVSLSGSVQRAGVAEVPMGTTLRTIVDVVGGGPPPGRRVSAVAVGGPSSGVLPVSMLDTPIAPGLLHDSGVMLGAGGVVVLDESVGVVQVVRGLAQYNADESCGKCTPCREGTPRLVEVLDRLASGGGSRRDLDELRSLAGVVNAASLCGLGQAAGNPITSALHFFADDFSALVGA